MAVYENIEVTDELAAAVRTFGLQRQLTNEEALTQIIQRGLETLPDGCFCGRQKLKRRSPQ